MKTTLCMAGAHNYNSFYREGQNTTSSFTLPALVCPGAEVLVGMVVSNATLLTSMGQQKQAAIGDLGQVRVNPKGGSAGVAL